jgi:TPR repeat protein
MEGDTAVVAFDGKGLRLLDGCTAAGVYGARSVAREPALARFGGVGEIRLNLPGSVRWLEDDDVLDDPMSLAFLVTGEVSSMRSQVARADLRGTCEGATHFVRRFEVGIHAKTFGPPETFSSPEEVFREASKDGSEDLLPSCAKGGGGFSGVIEYPRCAKPLRLHLIAIGEPEPDPEITRSVERNPCPPGTFLHGQACGPPRAGVGHLCNLGDEAGCRTQCGLGHGGSCNVLGWMRDGEDADRLFEAACELGEMRGCLNRAERLMEESLPARAASLFKHACDGGNAIACLRQAYLHAHGVGVPERCDLAASRVQRACSLGLAEACSTFALGGSALGSCPGASLARRASFLRTGCAGGDARACTFLARGLTWDLCKASTITVRDAGQRVLQATPAVETACALGHAEACHVLGEIRSYERVPAEGRDPVRAVDAFERACHDGMGQSCALGAETLLATSPTLETSRRRITDLADRGCDLGEIDACLLAGERHELGHGAIADAEAAAPKYRKACEGDDRQACYGLSRVTLDKAEAARALERACPDDSYDSVPEACHQRATTVADGPTADRALATALWKKSCDGDYELGCAHYGDALIDSRDEDERTMGDTYLRRSCRRGLAWACKRMEARGMPPTSTHRAFPPRVRVGRTRPDRCRRFEVRVPKD